MQNEAPFTTIDNMEPVMLKLDDYLQDCEECGDGERVNREIKEFKHEKEHEQLNHLPNVDCQEHGP